MQFSLQALLPPAYYVYIVFRPSFILEEAQLSQRTGAGPHIRQQDLNAGHITRAAECRSQKVPKHDFEHLRSSAQHRDGNNALAVYDFLLVILGLRGTVLQLQAANACWTTTAKKKNEKKNENNTVNIQRADYATKIL